MEVTMLPELNVAVSVFVVPEVVPGTIVLNSPLPQLLGVCQLPLSAPEYQVLLPLAPRAARLATRAESMTSEKLSEPGTIRRRHKTPATTAKR
jgi:hypothetical protein